MLNFLILTFALPTMLLGFNLNHELSQDHMLYCACYLSLITFLFFVFQNRLLQLFALPGYIYIAFIYYVKAYTDNILVYDFMGKVYFIDRFNLKKQNIMNYAREKLGPRAELINSELTTDKIIDNEFNHFYHLVDSLVIIEQEVVPTFFDQYKVLIISILGPILVAAVAISVYYVIGATVDAIIVRPSVIAELHLELDDMFPVEDIRISVFVSVLKGLWISTSDIRLLLSVQQESNLISQYIVRLPEDKLHFMRYYIEFLVESVKLIDIQRRLPIDDRIPYRQLLKASGVKLMDNTHLDSETVKPIVFTVAGYAKYIYNSIEE